MNNNNPWLALTKPLRHRPGDATEPPRRTPGPGRPAKLAATVDEVRRAHRSGKDKNPWNLSPKRLLILDMLVQGMTRRQIAERLDNAYPTVVTNISIMLGQMNAGTVPEAIVMWHRHFRVLLPDLNEEASAKSFAERLAQATTRCQAQNATERKEAA